MGYIGVKSAIDPIAIDPITSWTRDIQVVRRYDGGGGAKFFRSNTEAKEGMAGRLGDFHKENCGTLGMVP